MRSVFLASLIALLSVDCASAGDWTGFYVGGFGGAAWTSFTPSTGLSGNWDSSRGDLIDRSALLPRLNSGLSETGAIGGVALGVNSQSGSFVAGMEIDASALDSDSSHTLSVPSGPGNPYRTQTAASIDWLGTARLRAGWSFGRTLVYGTGGIAVGDVSLRQDITQLNTDFKQSSRTSDAAFGWVVGGGVEHALTEHWSLKAQYLHVDLDTASTASNGECQHACSPSDVTYFGRYAGSHSAQVTLDTLTAGVNYHF